MELEVRTDAQARVVNGMLNAIRQASYLTDILSEDLEQNRLRLDRGDKLFSIRLSDTMALQKAIMETGYYHYKIFEEYVHTNTKDEINEALIRLRKNGLQEKHDYLLHVGDRF